MLTGYWPDDYLQKRRTAAEAVAMLRPGQRVFIGSSCGEPQALVRELAAQSNSFADVEVVRLLSLETTPLSTIADRTDGQSIRVRSFYLGSAKPRELSQNRKYITPINLSAVPSLFKTRRLPLHAALIQVSPPDDFGWMSLGISVDVTAAAAEAADLVIAQVNPNMPRILGRSFIHVNDVDVFVEYEEDLITLGIPPETESAHLIGQHAAKLIDDGSTLQLSLGATPQAVLQALQEKNDLGIHTQFLSDGIVNLTARGVITNRLKGLNEGKLVASSAVGSTNLYEFVNDNPGVSFFPSDYVNDPNIISQNRKMVSINVVMAMDLTGQAAADALPYNHFSGVTGTMDFVRGARQSPGGRSILILPSTTMDGTSSRIVLDLDNMAVVVPRGDVQYVVTEYGVVNLFGKTLEERAMSLIGIAHPDFRDELFERAREDGLLSPKRTITESIHGIYPLALEDNRTIAGRKVFIRPARQVDERLIQEHFYNLNHDDVVRRFLHEKKRFARADVMGMSGIDYVHDLTIVAVIGEIGFEKAVAVGGYYLDPETNMAEVAYSVDQDWQKKGLANIIQEKLTAWAVDHGIGGFVAYTSPSNMGMVRLFDKLPYQTKRSLEGELLILTAKFNQPKAA